MTNALQVNQSTVVGGLGTQSYTVTTAGLYTLSFKSFIPYLASGGPAVTTQPSAAITNVTCVADSSGSLNNTYFTFNSAGDAYKFYVWYNINSAGTDPAVAGRTGIEVDAATNATANTIAANTRTAIAANATAASVFTVTGATSHVILTDIQYGLSTDAADGTAAPGFSYVITEGSFGAPATSGLVVLLKQGSTIKGTFAFPSPTQPIMGGSVVVNASVNDVLTFVASSLSSADNALNAVKSIVNLYQGE